MIPDETGGTHPRVAPHPQREWEHTRGNLAVCQKAPISTFDGTLIDDMSFGTLTAQVLIASNLPVQSAVKPTYLEQSRRHAFSD